MPVTGNPLIIGLIFSVISYEGERQERQLRGGTASETATRGNGMRDSYEGERQERQTNRFRRTWTHGCSHYSGMLPTC